MVGGSRLCLIVLEMVVGLQLALPNEWQLGGEGGYQVACCFIWQSRAAFHTLARAQVRSIP